MRKRLIHVLNWDKYQARSDKELPWCKLWGAIFKRPWFQELKDDEKFCTIAILDLARQFNNRITEESLFKGYLSRNYGTFISEERIFKLCKVLSDNEFLSDNIVGLEGDKIRVEETVGQKRPPFSIPSLEEVRSFVAVNALNVSPDIFHDHYTSNGWKIGKVPMKNWHSTIKNWSRREKSNAITPKRSDPWKTAQAI